MKSETKHIRIASQLLAVFPVRVVTHPNQNHRRQS